MPLTSHIVVTEPLTQEQWARIGWERRELLGSWGTYGAYVNHTADGRIAWGAYRSNYPFGSKVTDSIDRDEEIFAHGLRGTLDWFPMLDGIRFTHAWAVCMVARVITCQRWRSTGVPESPRPMATPARAYPPPISPDVCWLTRSPSVTPISPNFQWRHTTRPTGSQSRYDGWVCVMSPGECELTEESERTGRVPDRPALKLAQRWFDW